MKKGDICLVDLSMAISHEQFGKRPAIVISDTKTGIVLVVPLTSNLEALRYPYTFAILPDIHNRLDKESVALGFHLRAIDQSRIVKIVGRLDKKDLQKINRILKEMLQL